MPPENVLPMSAGAGETLSVPTIDGVAWVLGGWVRPSKKFRIMLSSGPGPRAHTICSRMTENLLSILNT